jgi:hypothetical protein
MDVLHVNIEQVGKCVCVHPAIVDDLEVGALQNSFEPFDHGRVSVFRNQIKQVVVISSPKLNETNFPKSAQLNTFNIHHQRFVRKEHLVELELSGWRPTIDEGVRSVHPSGCSGFLMVVKCVHCC